MKRVKIIVSGCVQGVFFRVFIKDKAASLGLTGYVRNTENGKVEAVVEGHETKIKELIDLCKQGPPEADVKKVEVKKGSYIGEFKQFSIKY